MATYTQTGRPLTVKTPLGEDVLLLTGLSGYEAISQLYQFQLDLVAENDQKIPFEKLLGQEITVELLLPKKGDKRHFSGICNRVGQGERDVIFTIYRLEIVPQFWFLTRKSQS